MVAAAEAHHATGAPIAIHNELGTAADAVLDLLVDESGIPAGERDPRASGPGIPYLLTGLRPRLVRYFGDEIATQLLAANPARAFVLRGTVRE